MANMSLILNLIWLYKIVANVNANFFQLILSLVEVNQAVLAWSFSY